MRILFMSAEIFPYAKTGGLGDVAAALTAALRGRGADVRLLLPGFPKIMENLSGIRDVAALPAWDASARLLRGKLPGGFDAYVVNCPAYYARTGFYVDGEGLDWSDNHRRFGLLCRAGAWLERYDPDWRPDVIHCNDWHCGLTPAYVAGKPAPRPATVMTVHNIAYQGLFPRACMADLDLPAASFSMYGLEYYGKLGFLKAGLFYADAITTVSPTYAQELQRKTYGCGLEGLLRDSRHKSLGILNGIDRDVWNPATDSAIARHYTAETLSLKKENKKRFTAENGMKGRPSRPLFGVISRLTAQKGMDMLLAAMPDILARGASFAILGTGDKALEERFAAIAKRWPGRIFLHIGYDEALAHKLQAACDAILIPSRFEPCGLVQMYAMRYGALPVVRKTGGLADTVTDGKTGFVFKEQNAKALNRTLRRVLEMYKKPAAWRKMQRAAMAMDFNWDVSAEAYMTLYRKLLAGPQQRRQALRDKAARKPAPPPAKTGAPEAFPVRPARALIPAAG